MKTKITTLFALFLMADNRHFCPGNATQTVPERVKATMDKITPALNLNPPQLSSTDSVLLIITLRKWKCIAGCTSLRRTP